MTVLFFTLTGVGIIMSFIRIMLGPTTSDRVAALDTMNVMITGSIVFLALLFKSSLYLDIALVYALLSFLETVVISRYMEGKK